MIKSAAGLVVAVLVCHVTGSSAFVLRNCSPRATCSHLAKLDNKDQQTDMNPLTRASWYAVEAFGKVFGSNKQNVSTKTILEFQEVDLTQSPLSMRETIQRIQLDNDRSYFLSGNVDTLIYDPDCVFSDPFVSFEGRDRFVDNLANLGSFITKYSAKMINYTEEQDSVKTRVRMKTIIERLRENQCYLELTRVIVVCYYRSWSSWSLIFPGNRF
jgi:hypothetical protein